MERLLSGHFARHGHPTTYAELAELAELLSGGEDNTQELERALSVLIERKQIAKRTIQIDHDECSQSSQTTNTGADAAETSNDQDKDADADKPVPLSSITVAYWPRTPSQIPKTSSLLRKMNAASKAHEPTAADKLAEEIASLRAKRDALQQEIDALAASCPVDLDVEAFIQQHIKRLHDYNEIKDIGQMLLGKCAEREQTTTKEMYGKFGLELDD